MCLNRGKRLGPTVLSVFNKVNVMAEVKRNGIFTLRYRILMEDKPLHVQKK